ncbi:MAG TPA: MFS transporter [Oceanipulchritudo sp.]|nr:MFS transporter [Oceanipulchritudo sp.]
MHDSNRKSSVPRAGTHLATRLSFFAAGFAMACWAPLVPFAKARIGADDGQLGLILLCLGVGSILAMPLTGWLSARFGSKPMIIGGGIGMAALLPLLAATGDARVLGATLLGFGAALGTIDVAMNIHAVEVERQAKRSVMSGFHAMFSVGGFIGAGGMTLLLSLGLSPLTGAIMASLLTLGAIVAAWPRLLPARGIPTHFVLPHGIVLLIALLGAITFLVEGAILDWSALLIIDTQLARAEQGGLGYMLFSIAMTAGRLTGDRVVTHFGNFRTLTWGSVTTVAGFVILLTVPIGPIAMTGFLLIGIGASNIVPVLFRLAGTQTVMPMAMAVAALTTIGYAGILAGPAMVGFVSDAVGLRFAFWLLAALMGLVAVLAKPVTQGR